MYQDDEDWLDHQDLNRSFDIKNEDGETRKRGLRIASGKRMPVHTEELVRLMLQGLRDVGYE